MYMTGVKILKDEVKFEVEKSINSKLKTEILGVQFQETEYAGITAITVVFKNDNGTATGLLQYKDDSYVLLAPMKVHFNKKEEKKNA